MAALCRRNDGNSRAKVQNVRGDSSVDHDADETLDDLHKTLEHASDMIDEIGDKDEKE